MKSSKSSDEDTFDKVEELKHDLRKAQREFRSAKDKSMKEMLADMISDLKLDLGWKLFDCGKFEEGLELYESVPWTSWGESKCNGLARALTETGHYDEAKRLLRKGLREFPDSYLLWTALGVLHDRRGAYSQALKCFEKAIRVSPEDDQVLFHNKVVVLDNMGLQYYAESFLYEHLKI
jgi:tetratricopeptide (TPR) repeat protein